MEMALAFGRHDVDRFLHEIDNDDFDEWQAFFVLRPTGWNATNLQTARLAYAAVQPHTRKKVDESKFLLRPGGHIKSLAEQKAGWEAAAISSRVRERIEQMKRQQAQERSGNGKKDIQPKRHPRS